MSNLKSLLGFLNRHTDLLHCILIIIAALAIGLFNNSNSGSLWPDSPQYANAAAMIRDWLVSGDILNPYEFASKNYAQYPAFHMPYHPPVYPGILGLVFVVTGVSYFWARAFVALCLGAAGCFFYGMLRNFGGNRLVSFGCTLLMVTIPEIALWSRDTMSEIPALALILAGSYFFVVSLRTTRIAYYWIAFANAEMAFMSRVLRKLP